jgi:DNA primase
MRFPPSLLDEIRARLPVSQVVSRKVALKRAGREFKGLSPFKQERTPSFTVNDQKGFYHCFASGEHGDIFTFVVKTEGLSFPEAVERLAEEAGVPMPKASPRETEFEDQRARLQGLLATASDFFEKQLATQGQEARRYLEKRGLTRETVARFRLGYAPASKSALKEHLGKAGFATAEMITAGMLIANDDIAIPRDRFRHRIMFPITDLKGRVIAFGGRALDPDAPAKYLNSPETPLFHKGAVLFNAYNARGPAHDKDQVIAVEGYMDVIALSEAGFPQTVAPLGTALTEDQLKLLWRMAPEPILCFDGDAAGRRAAFRAVETALPHLKPGYSVQFAFLPDGLDPDDFVRQHGANAFQDILDSKTRPLFDVLIEREEQQGQPAVTPEQRASLEARLKALVAQIGDRAVRDQYDRELWGTLRAKDVKTRKQLAPLSGRRAPHVAAKRRDNTQPDWRVRERASEQARLGGRPRAALAPAAAPRSNELSERAVAAPPREALLIVTLLNHPWLLEEHCEDVAELTLTSTALTRVRDALLELLASGKPLDSSSVRTHLSGVGLDVVVALAERAIAHKSDKFADVQAEASEVAAGWRHTFELHERQVGLRMALEAAERAWNLDPSEAAWHRIVELQQRIARRSEMESPGHG